MSVIWKSLVATVALAVILPSGSALAQSPMGGIVSKMTDVSGDLAKTVTGKPVQEKEESIVRDLDELIAQLEKQCQGCKMGCGRGSRPDPPPTRRSPAEPAAWAI